MHRIRLSLVAFLTATLALGLAGPAQARSESTDASVSTQWTICTPFVDLGPWRWSAQWGLYYQTMLVQITGCGGANILMHEEYVAVGDHGNTELERDRIPDWGDRICINANECRASGSHSKFLTAAEYARLTFSCITGTFFVTRAGVTNQGSVTDCNPWPAFDGG